MISSLLLSSLLLSSLSCIVHAETAGGPAEGAANGLAEVVRLTSKSPHLKDCHTTK